MSEFSIVKEMVINRRYGGFGLSAEASEEIARRKGWKLSKPDKWGQRTIEGEYQCVSSVIDRCDPDLVAVVREMGEKSWGISAKLEIVQVSISIYIDDFDGMETVKVSGGAGPSNSGGAY